MSRGKPAVTHWEVGERFAVDAALYNAKNPFAAASTADALLFNKHTGSLEWWNALKRDGSRVDLAAFLRKWKQDALAFQQASRRFWLYE